MRTHLLAAGLLVFQAVVVGAVTGPLPGAAIDDPFLGHYDVRILGHADLDRVAAAYGSGPLRQATATASTLAAPMKQAADQLRAAVPGVRIEASPLGIGIESVGTAGAPLTAPAPNQESRAIVLGFLRAHAGVWGLSAEQIDHLEIVGESTSGGTRSVNLRQTVHGRPVFQSDTRALLDAQGRLLHIVGRLVPGIDESTVPKELEIGPRQALQSAMRSVGVTVDPRQLGAATPHITRPVVSEAVYFPLAPGLVVPAWSQIIITRGSADWYTVVDARTGTLLWRKDIRYHAVPRLGVYVSTDHQIPLAGPVVVTEVCSGTHQRRAAERVEVEAPEPWFTSSDAPTTSGTNADVFLDRDADDVPNCRRSPCTPGQNPRPQADQGGLVFPYQPPPVQCDPDDGGDPSTDDYQNGAMTQLFYLINWFHDRIAELGFDQPFQEDDRILAEAQYGADRNIFNLASFTAPPDGTSGILRLSLWNGPEPDRDASLDAEVVFHELAHGVTSRMICNGAGLNWFPGRALAEGWSDFYALALLNDGATEGSYALGSYSAYKLGGHDFTDNYRVGMRRYPYATDLAVNPLRWKDIDDTTDCFTDFDPNGPNNPQCTGQSSLHWELSGANEIHNAGELWAASLWEMRAGIMARCGTTNGNDLTLKLVTDALRTLRCDPGFIDARDALLAAAAALSGSCDRTAVEEAIWNAFARWGLGKRACDSGGISTHYGIRPSSEATGEPAADCPSPHQALPVEELGEPLTFTANVSAADGVIPDGDANGHLFTLQVPVEATIGDLQLKINLTHSWVGDLTVMLKGPDGYGTDLVYRLANMPRELELPAPVPGMNGGADFRNTVLADGDGDLMTAGRVAAPFTGSWSPVLTSPVWLSSATGGQLSPFIGKHSQGDWKLFVSDVVSGDSGSLESWALQITPQNDDLRAPIAGTQRAQGNFTPGRLITYELALTNPASTLLPNGSGPELRETLPPELAPLARSVRASRGRASIAGNELLWNGWLPPGGSVRITFDARIRPGTEGHTAASQGRLRYDSNGDRVNDAEAVTDDPATPVRGDANRFVIAPPG